MATEQLPASTVIVGGQATLTNWIVESQEYGFVEDGETIQEASGTWLCDVTYSRRQTLTITLKAKTGATVSTYQVGGTIASGVFTKADGSTAVGWKIRDSKLSKTRGINVVQLDLIALDDEI